MVENMAEGGTHLTLDGGQGMVYFLAQRNCYPQPW
jgi:hypothetical protein